MASTVAPVIDLTSTTSARSSVAAADSRSSDVVIGIALTCDDVSEDGENRRIYRFYRDRHRTVDLIRATMHPRAETRAEDGTFIARATFSSPVMSRKHAQILFTDDNLVTLSDVGSLHGTYVAPASGGDNRVQERLEPNRPYTLNSDDMIYLGKSIDRDDKCWKPVVIHVKFLKSSNCMTPYLMNASTSKSKTVGGQSSYGIRIDVDDEAEEEGDGDSSDSGSSQRCNSSSPDTSPLGENKPLELLVNKDERDSVSSQPGSEQEGSELRGLRSILPLPFQRIHSLHNFPQSFLPLPPLRSLPSLRELGFFGASKPSAAGVGEPLAVGGNTLPRPNLSLPIPRNPLDQPLSSRPADSPVSEEPMSPLSSYPQNQLGLLDVNVEQSASVDEKSWGVSEKEEQRGLDVTKEEVRKEEVEATNAKGNIVASDSLLLRVHDDGAWEAPMEISPSSSRDPSPVQAPHFKIPEPRRSASQAAEDLRRRAQRECRAARSWPVPHSQPVATSSRHVVKSRLRRRPVEGVETRKALLDVASTIILEEMRLKVGGMEEDMRHMSDLVHDIVFKLEKNMSEAQADPTMRSTEQAIQVDTTAPKQVLSRVSSEEPEGVSRTLKRKRCEDEEVEEVGHVQVSENSQSSPAPSERPTKRLRSGLNAGGIARSVATAAGYTSLGAVLTWAALAYV